MENLDYFKIKRAGFHPPAEREEIEIHAGEYGNIILYKTDEGFVIDVYGQDDCVATIGLTDDDLLE